MFDWFKFQQGAIAFLIAFAMAGAYTLAFKLVYQWVTPYHEHTLIRQGNTAAAIALGGALIGYVLPLASALSHTVSLMEFAAWALLAGVIQILSSLLVRRVIVRDMVERIEANNIASAVYLAATSIGVGLLNAASMTY